MTRASGGSGALPALSWSAAAPAPMHVAANGTRGFRGGSGACTPQSLLRPGRDGPDHHLDHLRATTTRVSGPLRTKKSGNCIYYGAFRHLNPPKSTQSSSFSHHSTESVRQSGHASPTQADRFVQMTFLGPRLGPRLGPPQRFTLGDTRRWPFSGFEYRLRIPAGQCPLSSPCICICMTHDAAIPATKPQTRPIFAGFSFV